MYIQDSENPLYKRKQITIKLGGTALKTDTYSVGGNF